MQHQIGRATATGNGAVEGANLTIRRQRLTGEKERCVDGLGSNDAARSHRRRT
jgi:hypothetical protein